MNVRKGKKKEGKFSNYQF